MGSTSSNSAFVARRIDCYDIVYGSEVYSKFDANGESRTFFELVYEDPVEIDPETIGQFIGFSDKNGDRIFEGDALYRFDVQGGQTVIVAYRAGLHGFARFGQDGECTEFEPLYDSDTQKLNCDFSKTIRLGRAPHKVESMIANVIANEY